MTKNRTVVVMPIGANIPKVWVVRENDALLAVDMPSRTIQGETHRVVMDKQTRVLTCSCPGFFYNGHCSHTAGLIWICYKKARSKGVQDTSLAAYYSFTPEELGDRQRKVYDELLKGGPGSNNELAARLRWPINTVTPRILELREMGAVIEFGTQVSACNKTEIIWMALKWSK